MKTKSINKFAAVLLALAMLLTLIPLSPIARAEDTAADNGAYVLDAANLTNVQDKNNGTFTDGQEPVAAGTEDFFKIHVDKNTRFDTSSKSFDDGYAGTQRINFNGGTKTDSFVNSIEFTAKYPATVKVWWLSGDVGRYVALFDQSGSEVVKTDAATGKNDVSYIDTFEVPAAGKYYIGNVDKTNYIFKIEVTEHAPVTYELDAAKLTNVQDKNNGTFTDGQEPVAAGTEDFFKIHVDKNTRFDTSSKSFDDGYAGTQRINFNGGTKTDSFVNSIEFTVAGPATAKVWWLSGDVGRYVALFDQSGSEVGRTAAATGKNDVSYIDTFDIPAAGKYYIGNVDKTNYIFKIEVTAGAGEIVRGDWGNVAAPVINDVSASGSKIQVTVNANVGTDGGDEVVVKMLDSDGNVVDTKRSLAAKDEHTLEFTPTATDTYTFTATLSREGETSKDAASDASCDFTLPLGKPTIASVTSMGGGKMAIVWSAVSEADKYYVYCNGEKVGETETTAFTVEGLTVGDTPEFTVSAVRGVEEGTQSAGVTAKVTAEEQRVWAHTHYGPSASSSSANKYSGNLNEDGEVTVISTAGKIQPNNADGLSFYYTAIPNDLNFTLRANVHIDSWTYSNGQEGFGMLAIDSLPEKLGQATHWTNQYMLAVSKMEYTWDDENGKVSYDGIGTKYSMKLGIGVNTKLGITPELMPKLLVADTDTVKAVAPGTQYPLEFSAVGSAKGTYNIVGNATNPDKIDGTISEITDFIFEIQRNNTGYFLTYYAQDGKTVIGRQKFYDPNALSLLDQDNVYVGFFASRNAEATFSNVVLTTIAPADDAPAEEMPVEEVTPVINITSASVANSEDYTLMLNANVNGTAAITLNGVADEDGMLTANELFKRELTLAKRNGNRITVVFTPDPDQDLGEGKRLANSDPITVEITVNYDTKFANQKNLYIAPHGKSTGNGGPDYPLDVYTAVKVVKPGQTIVVMEGTYNLTSSVRIERGIDGTANEPIRMIADPEAASRPVFDFSKACEGFRLGGSYWVMKGFDVTNSGNGLAGFRVCGNNNTLDQIDAYNNGNTGIQISAFRDSNDPRDLWPQNNLILNCTSFNNADAGYEDADGFAAKLTIGEGNVFDGCAAYNNADDGWDLFAKVSSGSIGSVTIRNCIAYNNGFLLDGTDAGNGNGFKLGGDNLPGGHKLINSVAFNNKADGITSNSCPDIQVIGCSSFNNGKYNLNLYTNNAGTATAFKVNNCVSFINNGNGNSDRVKTNTNDSSDYISETNYMWNGSKSVNSVNEEITADMFETLVFGGLVRRDDGTIDLKGFMKLNDKAPDNTGADLDKEGGSTSSGDVGEITPDETLPAPDISRPYNPTAPSTPSDNNSIEFEDEDTDIEVTAPVGAFDSADDIKFKAEPVLEETTENTFTFDLTFTDGNGNKVQPKIAVTVRIPVPAALVGKTIYVYHVENNGSYTEIDCKVEDGIVVFTASSFSKYIITSEKLNGSDNSDDNGNNSDTPATSASPDTSNPSTGAGLPAAGMAAALVSLAVVCVFKRKH